MSNKRVVISIPKSLLEIVDRTTAEEHRSHSEFFLGKQPASSSECGPSGNGTVAEPPLSGPIVLDSSVVLKSYLKSNNLSVSEVRGREGGVAAEAVSRSNGKAFLARTHDCERRS